MSRLIDMTGQRFGRLLILGRSGAHWACRCDCGQSAKVRRKHLIGGHTVSCGCRRNQILSELHETNQRHMMSGSPTHRVWIEMRRRCRSAGRVTAKYYFDRGVTVCEHWQSSFEDFLADMGERPPGTTIDRIDGTRGYEPANCRWATPQQQRANQLGRTVLTEDIRQEIRGRLEHGERAVSVARRVGFSRSLVDQVRAGSR